MHVKLFCVSVRTARRKVQQYISEDRLSLCRSPDLIHIEFNEFHREGFAKFICRLPDIRMIAFEVSQNLQLQLAIISFEYDFKIKLYFTVGIIRTSGYGQ